MKTRIFAVSIVLSLLFVAACSKKVATVTPPPPPPPAAPTATLVASPEAVQQGQSTTLTWRTDNANDITISGLGVVPASGSRSVQPGESTTYRLIAKGPGGEREATARVTVSMPQARTAPSLSDQDLFARNVKDIFFDYDKYALRPSDSQIAQSDAQFLAQHPSIKLVIEGHCDERGSEEYNMALGDNRAETVKAELLKMGIGADRIKIISYGKEKPFCAQEDEQCFQQNRRAHFVFQE